MGAACSMLSCLMSGRQWPYAVSLIINCVFDNLPTIQLYLCIFTLHSLLTSSEIAFGPLNTYDIQINKLARIRAP